MLLSQELQTPGEVQTQIETVIEYRAKVEDAAGELAPVQPQGFLLLLVETTRENAQRLGGFVHDGGVQNGGAEIEAEIAALTEQMDQIATLLCESGEDTITVLSVTGFVYRPDGGGHELDRCDASVYDAGTGTVISLSK